MTKDQAYDKLGLPNGAGRTEILETFEAAYSKAQQELTHAETEELKGKFRKRLTELMAAKNALIDVSGPLHDRLPVAEPVVETVKKGSGDVEKGFGGAPLKATGAQKGDERGAAISMWLIAATIVMAAALTYFAMKYFEMKPKAEWHDKMKNVLSNGTFEVVNSSEHPYLLVGVDVFYLDGDSIVQRTFEPKVILEPNRPYKLPQFVRKNELLWDGEVLFYSMVVGDPEGKGEFTTAPGIWPQSDGKGRSPKLYINYDDRIFPKQTIKE